MKLEYWRIFDDSQRVELHSVFWHSIILEKVSVRRRLWRFLDNVVTVFKISHNISNLCPHGSIDMYILVFHKERKNADNMELNEN